MRFIDEEAPIDPPSPALRAVPAPRAYDDGDFQSWYDFYAVKKVNDKVAVRVEEELQSATTARISTTTTPT